MENFDGKNIEEMLEIHQICQYFPFQNFVPYMIATYINSVLMSGFILPLNC